MPAELTVPETKLIAPQTSPPGLERWHIDDYRRNKKGAVTKVHHVIWGWMRPSSLYFLEKLHDLFPGVNATGNSLAHGGYIFKSAVVSTAPSVFGLSLPIGVGLYTWAAINMYNNVQNAQVLDRTIQRLQAVIAAQEQAIDFLTHLPRTERPPPPAVDCASLKADYDAVLAGGDGALAAGIRSRAAAKGCPWALPQPPPPPPGGVGGGGIIRRQ